MYFISVLYTGHLALQLHCIVAYCVTVIVWHCMELYCQKAMLSHNENHAAKKIVLLQVIGLGQLTTN